MSPSWMSGSCSAVRPWMVVTVAILAGVSLIAAAYATSSKRRSHVGGGGSKQIDSLASPRVAFLGNSIFYYNDCPRLLQHMVTDMVQNSCLRGGASLVSLFTKGNGMQEKFASPNALLPNGTYDIGAPTMQELLKEKWDFVLINDYTQAPARAETRQETIQVLKQSYAPLLRECGAVPVFLQTAAYRVEGIRDTQDLGGTLEFTQLLQEGYQEYQKALAKELPVEQQPRVAPVGNAFLYVHQHNLELWNKLFWTDNFHPSPYGTWLQACVLYITLFDQAPPVYNNKWWETARYFPDDEKNMTFPTPSEAHELREVACVVCGVGKQEEEELPDPQ